MLEIHQILQLQGGGSGNSGKHSRGLQGGLPAFSPWFFFVLLAQGCPKKDSAFFRERSFFFFWTGLLHPIDVQRHAALQQQQICAAWWQRLDSPPNNGWYSQQRAPKIITTPSWIMGTPMRLCSQMIDRRTEEIQRLGDAARSLNCKGGT